MLCRVANLCVEVPATGDMESRCKDYLCEECSGADIVIDAEQYHPELYPKELGEDLIVYLESGWQFYAGLLRFGGLMLHASAVELDGKAYLFSGPSGMGKSTHTKLWQQIFGEKAQVFNDDKPALRREDGRWYAYGTPWCGKDGINQNKRVPLAGICFLKRGQENVIRRLEEKDVIGHVLYQTLYRFKGVERLDALLNSLSLLVKEIPVFELENLPEEAAARLSYETMNQAAKEMGL